jgi:hypothetical protein
MPDAVSPIVRSVMALSSREIRSPWWAVAMRPSKADYLTRYAAKVYLIHRRDEFRASKILQERLFANQRSRSSGTRRSRSW